MIIHLCEKISDFKQWDPLTQTKFFQLVQEISLTKFLKSLSDSFSVQLTFLGSKILTEQDVIAKERQQNYFVREVNLLLEGEVVVRARSSCLVNSQFWVNFLNCGTQPLGEKLYNYQNIDRTPLIYLLVSRENSLVRNIVASDIFLARQSIFKMFEQCLILTECFLPTIKKFIQ